MWVLDTQGYASDMAKKGFAFLLSIRTTFILLMTFSSDLFQGNVLTSTLKWPGCLSRHETDMLSCRQMNVKECMS